MDWVSAPYVMQSGTASGHAASFLALVIDNCEPALTGAMKPANFKLMSLPVLMPDVPVPCSNSQRVPDDPRKQQDHHEHQQVIQAPLLKNFTLIIRHIENVLFRRKEAALRADSRLPHTPFFVNTTMTPSRTYEYTPVIQWRRYGKSLQRQHGDLFMSALFDSLRVYMYDVRSSEPERASHIGHGLLELGLCWDWDPGTYFSGRRGVPW